MPKPTVGPVCKYHDDTMLISTLVVLLGGHSFRIYACPFCTYIEFHDTEPA